MMKLVAQWILNALALYIVAEIVPGIELRSFGAALVAICVMALVNMFIKPVVLLLTLPVTVVTLGLFVIVINVGMFMLVGNLTPGFYVNSWGAAFLGSLLYFVLASIGKRLVES